MNSNWIKSAAGLLLGLLAAATARAEVELPVLAQGGGEVNDMVLVGNIAYVGEGTQVGVYRLSASGALAPERVGASVARPGVIQGLLARQGFLYATWRSNLPDSGLSVFSLADPQAPALVAEIDYTQGAYASAGGLAAAGNHLYLADSENGLVALSLATPAAPVPVGVLAEFGMQRLATHSKGLLAWGRNFFGQLNLSTIEIVDPTQPALLGSYQGSGFLFDVVVQGDLAVMVGGGGEVISLADFAAPVQVSTIPDIVSGNTALWSGDHLILGEDQTGYVVDLSDPATPQVLPPFVAPMLRSARLLRHDTTAGAEAVVATNGGRLLTLSLTNPAVPMLRHDRSLPVGSDPTDVGVDGAVLWSTDFYSGLRGQSVSLAPLGRNDFSIPMGAHEGIAVRPQRAYVASWGYGLLVVDTSTPAAPVVLGQVEIPFASAVDVAGRYAYVVTSTNGGILHVVDLVDERNPVSVHQQEITKGSQLLVSGNLLLVADAVLFGPGGLRVFDLSNPAAPAPLAFDSQCDSAGGVDALGSLVAIACHDGSLRVFDLSTPSAPVQRVEWRDPTRIGSAYSVLMGDGQVWFGHDEGVDLIDISRLDAPRRVAATRLPWSVRRLRSDGAGGAYAVAGSAGLHHLGLPELSVDQPIPVDRPLALLLLALALLSVAAHAHDQRHRI